MLAIINCCRVLIMIIIISPSPGCRAIVTNLQAGCDLYCGCFGQWMYAYMHSFGYDIR